MPRLWKAGGDSFGPCLFPRRFVFFGWRVFHNIIPAEQNLRRHHVPISGWCPLCMNQEDSTSHAIISCPMVRGFWKGNPVWTNLKRTGCSAIQDICFWVMNHLSKADCEEFMCQAWLIWGVRCTFLHDQEKQELQPPRTNASVLLEDYRAAVRDLSINQHHSATTSQETWQPPLEGTVRIDVDASFNTAAKVCGLGGVIRGNDGTMVIAFGLAIPKPDTVVMGELFAIREGLRLAKERGFHDICICSDSLLAVQAVTSPTSDLSYVGSCAQEIRCSCLDFTNATLSHVRRSANEVAHFLSKFAISSPAPFEWVPGNSPLWVDQLVMRDHHQ
ncbi:uncharacterized protein [Primulina eburnea]|uniref:uncharacterized protein n=1 Tax=Primulina eburnea TaxID=1245227 RepID=UPI003C6C61B8